MIMMNREEIIKEIKENKNNIKRIIQDKVHLRIAKCCEDCIECEYSSEYYIKCNILGKVYGHSEYVVCNLFKVVDTLYSKAKYFKEWKKDGLIED